MFLDVHNLFILVSIFVCGCLKIILLSMIVSFFRFFLQLALLKSIESPDIEWSKEVKGCMYDMVVEGFQLLSRWSCRIWEQCAWKFSRPCKDFVEPVDTSSVSDYEKVSI